MLADVCFNIFSILLFYFYNHVFKFYGQNHPFSWTQILYDFTHSYRLYINGLITTTPVLLGGITNNLLRVFFRRDPPTPR